MGNVRKVEHMWPFAWVSQIDVSVLAFLHNTLAVSSTHTSPELKYCRTTWDNPGGLTYEKETPTF